MLLADIVCFLTVVSSAEKSLNNSQQAGFLPPFHIQKLGIQTLVGKQAGDSITKEIRQSGKQSVQLGQLVKREAQVKTIDLIRRKENRSEGMTRQEVADISKYDQKFRCGSCNKVIGLKIIFWVNGTIFIADMYNCEKNTVELHSASPQIFKIYISRFLFL